MQHHNVTYLLACRTASHENFYGCNCRGGIYLFILPITPYILKKIFQLHRKLSAASINVIQVKVPRHAGIEGNETADRHAKDMAFRLFKGEISAPDTVSVQTAFKIAGEIAMKSWQRFWYN